MPVKNETLMISARKLFNDEPPAESEAIKELRLAKEREIAKVARLRALRLAKEAIERDAGNCSAAPGSPANVPGEGT